jgi:hypothetical protein
MTFLHLLLPFILPSSSLLFIFYSVHLFFCSSSLLFIFSSVHSLLFIFSPRQRVRRERKKDEGRIIQREEGEGGRERGEMLLEKEGGKEWREGVGRRARESEKSERERVRRARARGREEREREREGESR